MPTFAIIDPTIRNIRVDGFASFHAALRAVNMTPGEAMRVKLSPWCGIAVHQHGLYEPVEKQALFSIGRLLLAGKAVIYGLDPRGEPSHLNIVPPPVLYYSGHAEAMQAIESDRLDQPSVKIGNSVIWVWPQPLPGYQGRKEEQS